MLRVLGKQIISLTKHVRNDFLIRTSTTRAPFEREKTEYNYVRLSGTIVSNVRTLPNGAKSLIVRTTEEENVYSNHHVNVKRDELIAKGQRIYIFGNLAAKPFSLDNGRIRQKLTVKSTYFRLRGHERNAETKDQNNVKILAKIVSEIRITDKYILFTLESNHTPKGDGKTTGQIITDFHPVLVYDHQAYGVARNLNQFDRILVEGKISYMPYKNADGKTQHGGFIVAHKVEMAHITNLT